jgi:hypothetical protein
MATQAEHLTETTKLNVLMRSKSQPYMEFAPILCCIVRVFTVRFLSHGYDFCGEERPRNGTKRKRQEL